MSVLEPNKHFKESEAKRCPLCEVKLVAQDIIDVDADDDFSYYKFHCKNCNGRFTINKPYDASEWAYDLEYWQYLNESR